MSGAWQMPYSKMQDGLDKALMDFEKQMKAGVQEAALQAAIEGEDAARNTIATTPSSLSPGKDNRIWTSKMYYDIGSKVDQNGNTISIRVGWLDEQEPYFLVQEDGGPGPRGITITPMHALLNADEAIRRRLRKEGLTTND